MVSRAAFADTEEGAYYSDDAALMAGAVSAWTRDSGAIWYNPAGLGESARAQVSLNGSLYALKIRKIPNVLNTHFPGSTRAIDLSSTDIMSAPHATALAFRLSERLTLGIGIYISERDVRTSQSTLEFYQPKGNGLAFDANLRQHIDVASEVTKYNAGPAVGIELSETLRVGVNTFLTYSKVSRLALFEVDLAGVAGTPPPVIFALNNQHVTSNEFGLVAMLGAQWDPSRNWHLGATLRTPELRLNQSLDGSVIAASSSIVSGVSSQNQFGFLHAGKGGGMGMRVPPRAVVSVAHEFSEKFLASAEADFLPALLDSETGLDSRTVINVRAGVRGSLTERMIAGVGLFTDRDRQKLGPGLTDERIDRYGITAGVQLLVPFTLEDDDGPTPEGLVLGTTLALRYAMGIGEARALDYDSVTGTAQTRAVDVMYHEWTPYIGSSVSF